MQTRTRVEYLYRDASNYKFHGEFVVDGELTESDLEAFLFDREWFVPNEVGLPHLLDSPVNEDDHWLHEFTGFSKAGKETPICTASELIERFRDASQRGWFAQITQNERCDRGPGLERSRGRAVR